VTASASEWIIWAAAVQAAEFLRRELWDEVTGVLWRSYCEGRGNVPGFAEDYAYLIQGLLDLYEATFDIRWLQWAGQLQSRMDELFGMRTAAATLILGRRTDPSSRD